MTRPYVIYDVFTKDRLAGNPLAVVFEAGDLSTERMQAITKELNLSETVFVTGRAGQAAHLRIFTPGYELPFAGHPTVGTAVALAEHMQVVGNTELVLHEKIGPITAHVTRSAGQAGFAQFDLPRLSQPVDFVAEIDKVAEALGLQSGQIGFDRHDVLVWSAGVPFMLVPVKDLAAVAQVQFDASLWVKATHHIDGRSVSAFVYCRGGEGADAAFHARMFSPAMGIAEDPATGAAVAALTGQLHAADRYPDGVTSLLIEQGYEMGRPSQIHVSLTIAGGAITKAAIGGHAVNIASGGLEL